MQKQKIFNDKPVGYGGIAFNTKRAPFNDPRMRRALTLLFNRAQLVEKLMYNEYILSNSYYPNSIYENPGNPKQEYNPEKAAQLLTEIGYTSRNQDGILVKNGQPLEVEILVSQDQIRILTPFQQDLQKAGIKLNFRTVDASTRGKMSAEKNYSMTFQQWTGLLYPNPISSFNSKLADVANTNNITAFKNARADELMDKEQITFDPVERVRILRELDSILVAENTYALAYHVPFVRLVYWNRFGQPAFTLGRVSDWEDVLAQWWFDPEKAAVVQKGMNDKSVKMDIVPNENRYWLDYDKAHPVDLTSKAAGSGQANGGAAADSGAKAPGKAAPSVK
jgi:microcin C transport system substrate-binding protein